jgi:glycerol-3-phosphate dehydrogenase (NAD+)
MSNMLEKICIIGSGNWYIILFIVTDNVNVNFRGTTAGKMISENILSFKNQFDQTVKMWVWEETLPDGRLLSRVINDARENVKYLPGVKLPPNLLAVTSLEEAAKDATLLVFVLPHQFVEKACMTIKKVLCPSARAISLIKGIDSSHHGSESLLLISEQIKSLLNGKIDVAVLMGANIADEIAKKQFSEATIGCLDETNGLLWKRLFHNPSYFCIHLINQVRGVELCGTLKNIIAIAAGVIDGLDLGSNTKAAIMRIGLCEMRRFCQLQDPDIKDELFFESCGIADLVTTCIGGRNRKVAEALVRTGKNIFDLEREMLNGQKLQGPPAAIMVYKIAKEKDLLDSFPLFTVVYLICYEGYNAKNILDYLSNHEF